MIHNLCIINPNPIRNSRFLFVTLWSETKKEVIMSVKKYKSKEEATVAFKKAVERKRVFLDYIKKGYSAKELDKMGFKTIRFV